MVVIKIRRQVNKSHPKKLDIEPIGLFEMLMKRIKIYGLGDFNVEFSSLLKLNKRMYVRLFFSELSLTRLMGYKPKQRNIMLYEHRRGILRSLRKSNALRSMKLIGSNINPRGLEGWLNSGDVHGLQASRLIRDVFIEQISGIKRKKQAIKTVWFAVKSKYVIQVEGQTDGFQTHEHRIVIVKAKTPKEAERKVRAEAGGYGNLYLNPYGELVKWTFIEVLETKEIYDDPSKDPVVEVFSEMFDKKFSNKYRFRK